MSDNTLNNQVSEYCTIWMGMFTIYEDYAKTLGLSYSIELSEMESDRPTKA